jgi:DNA-binding PadR family transcriptional regulator
MHEHHFWKHFHHDNRDERRDFGGRGGPFGGRGGRRGGWFGFGPGGPGGFDVGRGRKLSSGELQLVLLALLDDKPRHGYDLIKAIDETSGGFYVPSPGVIYPALTYLEEAGEITAVAEGSRKLYSLTDAGREHLAKEHAVVDEILKRLEAIGERMGRVREAFDEDEPDFQIPPGPPPPFGHGPWGAHVELGKAFRDFHVAMWNAKRLSPEGLVQIVGIIRRAAAAIRDVVENEGR